MIKFISSYFILLTCSAHLFCCGIPFFLSLTSLSSSLGFTSLFITDLAWFEKFETYSLIFTLIILLCFIISEVNSRRLNCVEDGHCDHPPCDKKKRLVRINLILSIVIFSFNASVFLLEKF
tara:strand:+ start:762 stop:1124 length:363 start_codon:yes stop_codon:yes gene_type:complete